MYYNTLIRKPCTQVVRKSRFRHVDITDSTKLEITTFGVASGDRMVIKSFVKIDQLFQELPVGHTQTHCIVIHIFPSRMSQLKALGQDITDAQCS
jgi:hypothetical protein